MEKKIFEGFLDEMQKIAQTLIEQKSSSKDTGQNMLNNTRSPYYRFKRKAPVAVDLGSDLNRTSAKAI